MRKKMTDVQYCRRWNGPHEWHATDNGSVCACGMTRPAPSLPGTALRSDPRPTEETAAIRALPRSGTDRAALLGIIRDYGPMTCDEATVHHHTVNGRPDRPNQMASRIGELERDGWIRDTGITRTTRTGSPAIVWEYIPDTQ